MRETYQKRAVHVKETYTCKMLHSERDMSKERCTCEKRNVNREQDIQVEETWQKRGVCVKETWQKRGVCVKESGKGETEG